jgi:hypothetical protein
MTTLLLSGVLFLTQVWGHSILRAGLELTPGPLGALAAAVVASRVGPRIGMGTVGAIGGALVAIGIGWNAVRLGTTPDYLGAYLPGQIVGGLGVGLAIPSSTAVSVTAVGRRRRARRAAHARHPVHGYRRHLGARHPGRGQPSSPFTFAVQVSGAPGWPCFFATSFFSITIRQVAAPPAGITWRVMTPGPATPASFQGRVGLLTSSVTFPFGACRCGIE